MTYNKTVIAGKGSPSPLYAAKKGFASTHQLTVTIDIVAVVDRTKNSLSIPYCLKKQVTNKQLFYRCATHTLKQRFKE